MSKKQGILFFWGGVTGAALFSILAFSMGWVVTSGSAQALAREMSAEAVKQQLVPICLRQFDAQADKASQLDKLRGLERWEREGFVTEQGWATMPGGNGPEIGVARECAARLAGNAT